MLGRTKSSSMYRGSLPIPGGPGVCLPISQPLDQYGRDGPDGARQAVNVPPGAGGAEVTLNVCRSVFRLPTAPQRCSMGVAFFEGEGWVMRLVPGRPGIG